MPRIVDTNLQANLLAEAKQLYDKRARLEANLRAAEARYNHRIEAAALGEIDRYRIRISMQVKPAATNTKCGQSYRNPDDKFKPEAL